MRLHKRSVYLGLLLTIVACGASAKEKAEELARPLLQAAAERSLFEADKSSPFGLLMKFELLGPRSKPMQGAYSWVVTPDGDARREIKFADYSDLEIIRGTTLWSKRSLDHIPLQATWVQTAFRNFAHLNRNQDEFRRYWTTSDHHVPLRCMELVRDTKMRSLCFDQENNLTKVEFIDTQTVYEYSDFREFGSKYAPAKVSIKREGQAVLDGTIDIPSTDGKVDPSLLMPPSGARKQITCLNPDFPTLKTKVLPHYPEQDRSLHRAGTVIVYVLIAADGNVQNPTVIQTAGDSLDAVSLEAVRQWKYEPAKCGDVPVEADAEISINFSLQIR